MNVKELIEFLSKYPPDMVVLTKRCSDYCNIEEGDFEVVTGVNQGAWVMRAHPTMSEENKENEKQYLYLAGN